MKEQRLMQENDHILEIGFGTGKLIFEMAKQVNKGLIEDVILTDSIEIKTTPEKIFSFITGIVDGEFCLFIASGTYRLGWIGKTFFGKAIEESLSSVKKHMKEEGENLKRILES